MHEKVVHLDDVLLRRSMLAMLGHVTRATLKEVAVRTGRHARLGSLSASRLRWRVALNILQDKHQVQL